VPEPQVAAMLATGLAMLGWLRRLRRAGTSPPAGGPGLQRAAATACPSSITASA
jgi:hypothetical protein